MKPFPLARLVRCNEFALKVLHETAFASHHTNKASEVNDNTSSIQIREDISAARRAISTAQNNLALMMEALDEHLVENAPDLEPTRVGHHDDFVLNHPNIKGMREQYGWDEGRQEFPNVRLGAPWPETDTDIITTNQAAS